MDAWGSVDALGEILKSRDAWRGYELADDTRVLLLGHSNGGQGAWWNAARYPDRVAAGMFVEFSPSPMPRLHSLSIPIGAVIPAAAYLKSQAYVPSSSLSNEAGLATSVGFGPSPDSFTLTVSIPAESGSLTDGGSTNCYIGRLTVVLSGTSIDVRTNNVAVHNAVHFSREDGTWKYVPTPNTPPQDLSSKLLSATLRLASALDGYHKLDAEIIDDAEASLLSQERTAFTLDNRTLLLRGKPWERSRMERGLRLFPFVQACQSPLVVITDHADK
ncbi:uncharacterized protein B0H18DRAFT_1009468 [Fomitopsis serialis]|uniref:uncharacterized protein n=1 Tax=Fomitopsis serialis TaxID=139415 RepID=UPI00200863BC|nr:uncharacterized protein B0H18DRAFT_1009468 [Neoantrodia serialis]KAH9925287.1 hypothetical protein B0H18DRAFT_1009468 [Neoantrodia serialis]